MEPAMLIREVYKECMWNHSFRGYAVHSCCEYTADALRPQMEFCAACGCHRNCHRRVVLMGADPFLPRQRRRTRFSAAQKARMEAFAARIGWKVRNQEVGEEDEVTRFCREIGITRHVFKTWIRNHKGRAAAATSASNTAGAPADAEGKDAARKQQLYLFLESGVLHPKLLLIDIGVITGSWPAAGWADGVPEGFLHRNVLTTNLVVLSAERAVIGLLVLCLQATSDRSD